MSTELPHDDLMTVDDILLGFSDELSPQQRLLLKLGSSCNEQETRTNLEPGFSNALRQLGRASNEEGQLMASWS